MMNNRSRLYYKKYANSLTIKHMNTGHLNTLHTTFQLFLMSGLQMVDDSNTRLLLVLDAILPIFGLVFEWHLNSRPFKYWTGVNHFNVGHVHYLDGSSM